MQGVNVLTLGASFLTAGEAEAIVSAWLTTPMRDSQALGHLASIRDLEREMTPDELARLIDHTLLRPDATRRQIEALCAEALEPDSPRSVSTRPGSSMRAQARRWPDGGLHGRRVSAGRSQHRRQSLRSAPRSGMARARSTW